jgi:hypothetical protein
MAIFKITLDERNPIIASLEQTVAGLIAENEQLKKDNAVFVKQLKIGAPPWLKPQPPLSKNDAICILAALLRKYGPTIEVSELELELMEGTNNVRIEQDRDMLTRTIRYTLVGDTESQEQETKTKPSKGTTRFDRIWQEDVQEEK